MNLPIDIMLEMFDRTIVPIMLYGSEVFGYENCKFIENIHLKFCKYLLCVKMCTPSCMVYGELGRKPIDIDVKIRVVMYWIKILQSHVTKVNRIFYDVLFIMYNENTYHSKWLDFVRKTLFENGFGYIWLNQAENINQQAFKCMLKERLTDQYKQTWSHTVNDSRKCILYKNVKHSLEFEIYLCKIQWNLCKYLVRLRLCNHKLRIETGRYENIDRHERYCDMCDQDVIGDEFHLFYECKNVTIVEARTKFLPKEMLRNRSMYAFTNILKNLEDLKTTMKICKFLKATNIV